MRNGWLMGVMVCLAACVAAPPGIDADAALQRFVGRPIAEVRASWGEPQAIVAGAGEESYLWEASRFGASLPAILATDDVLRTEGGDEFPCRIRFRVVDGIVTAADRLGSECRQR